MLSGCRSLFIPSKTDSQYLNRYVDSERRFQHVLEACGVNKSLMKLGVKEGDTVIVGEVCCLLAFYSFTCSIACYASFHAPYDVLLSVPPLKKGDKEKP